MHDDDVIGAVAVVGRGAGSARSAAAGEPWAAQEVRTGSRGSGRERSLPNWGPA